MKGMILLVSVVLVLACKKTAVSTAVQEGKPMVAGKSYLALGDSYTIGQSVSQEQSFPYQLAANLSSSGIKVNPPVIIARTGWTTGDLQSAIQTSGLVSKFDMVTLLIGVNNQYRGNSIETYRKEFKELLQTAIDFAGGKKDHVFVISIPDWGVTPFGMQSGRNPQNITAEIDAFNAVNKQETISAGVSYTDITADSRLAASDRTLVAPDGLHPSGKMYLNWVSSLTPEVSRIFK